MKIFEIEYYYKNDEDRIFKVHMSQIEAKDKRDAILKFSRSKKEKDKIVIIGVDEI